MALSLYDASVRTYLQIVETTGGVLARGLEYCRTVGVNPDMLVEARLYPDMFPLRFQIHSVVVHSLGAVEAIKTGRQTLEKKPQHDYAGLQALIAETLAALKKVSPAEIDARAGSEIVFQGHTTSKVFATAEDYLFSFSLPNFYFHAVTAYDILRAAGVPVGKADFLGAVRLKA
jgi:uncharacterized protein